MPSLISGYEYDIFISYRQKDNKHDGWVTEFVNNLKGELESTFKEEISVYFDINPHDGLLETHDVDASLKEKLKCLIFIPVISRTYCDPKSFAWEHEFKAFVEQATKDQYGLKVKLSNGNVASRVLPVRIHELDYDDIKQCELILGGVIRGVEFIYKESGFNRPLKPDDDEKINLNKTKYRNQISKVTLAIKEIIIGMKVGPVSEAKEKDPFKRSSEDIRDEKRRIDPKNPFISGKSILISIFVFVVLLIIAGILAYPKIFKRDTLERLRSSGEKISVAVLPFHNNTNDSLLNVWQEGIQEILITSLSTSEDLKVQHNKLISSYLQSKGLTSYASITPTIASTISRKLDAGVMIYGGIKQSGSTLRLDAQLIDSKTEEVIKSFQVDGTSDKIMLTIDSLSVMIRNYLVVSKITKGEPHLVNSSWLINTNSPEAFRYFIDGTNAYGKGDYVTAKEWLLKSLEIDSTFFMPAYMLWATYFSIRRYDQAKYWCLKVYKNRDNLNTIYQPRINFMYSKCFGTDFEALKYLTQLTELDKTNVNDLSILGLNYSYVFQYNKAIPIFERVLKIFDEWDSKQAGPGTYILLGIAYHKTGQYKKEKRLYKKAEQDFPNNGGIIWRQAILALTVEDTISANRYIEKLIPIWKGNPETEAEISKNLAVMHTEAGILDKAEAYWREAISLDPENHYFMNDLAAVLIREDLNNNEWLELINKALALSPDHYEYLDTKGYGLNKQKRYQEALEILQKSWDLRMKNAVYSHKAFLNLEEAKKAVAEQSKN